MLTCSALHCGISSTLEELSSSDANEGAAKTVLGLLAVGIPGTAPAS